MSVRIKNTFEKLNEKNKSAFISFIAAGDPSFETSLEVLKLLPQSGVDIIELGIPFSDSMADGAIIQQASQRALKQGITPAHVFDMVKEFRKGNDHTPIILMGYYNPILAMGLKNFAEKAKEAGVDGALVVDLPPEEADELKTELDSNDIDLIFLMAPTTNDKRLKTILKKAKGFLYYVAITGVTGTKLAKDDEVKFAIDIIKKKTELPIVTGFGIKTPEMAGRIAKIADGVVVGTAIVEKIDAEVQNHDNHQKVIDNALAFVSELANSVKNNDNPK
ncbi:MAG: tryptophan synthase subunit alpha [Alphaproteobacteria bacterium]